MRRALILALALLVLCAAAVAVTAADIYESHDQVALTKTEVWGDPAMLGGLNVQYGATWSDHLFWDVRAAMDGGTETDYRFTITRPYTRREHVYTGISLETNPDYGVDFRGGAENFGLALAYEELYDSLKPGEEGSITVRLRDYCEYYPLAAGMDFPDSQWGLGPIDVAAGLDPLEEPDSLALYRLQEYFRIPVLENERYEITIRKSAQPGNYASGFGTGSSEEDDFFRMETVNAMTDEACFFTFSPRTNKGQLVDLSLLPDGFGIYRLPYTYDRRAADGSELSDIDVDGMTLFHALDPAHWFLAMEPSPDQSKLLVHTSENGLYVLTVLDTATGEVLQRLEITEFSGESYNWYHFDEGTYLVAFFTDTDRLALITEEGGRYGLEFLCDVYPEEMERIPRMTSVTAWDGSRLAFSGMLESERYYSSDGDTYYYSPIDTRWYVAVYDGTGLRCFTKVLNSLDTGVSFHNYDYYCRCLDEDPLRIWFGSEQSANEGQ